MKLELAVYRRLLRLYPEPFRRRHGGEMEHVFRERRDRVEGLGVAGFWFATLKDVGINAAAEHVHRRRRGRRETDGSAAGPAGPARRSGGGGMDGIGKDVRYAVRSLARSPGFTAATLLTLALGIGANTAIFSVVDAVLLRPLPYDQPDRLAIVWGRLTNRNVEHFPHSPPDLKDLRESIDAFESVSGVVTFNQPLEPPDGDPVQVSAGGATPDLFRTLGITPVLGRDFVDADGAATEPGLQPGDPGFVNNVGILSHEAWQLRFGGDPEVLGRIVQLGGTPTEIVGVLPAGFRLLLPQASNSAPRPEVWVAMRLDFEGAPRNNVFLQAVARLAPGATLEGARTEADRLAADRRREFEISATSGYELQVSGLHDELVAPVRPVILALMAAVGLLLLIACANVSNLLLVRGSRRQREVAIRAAVGGGRLRIIRQMLAESALLGVGGAVLGVGVAWLGIDLLLALRPDTLPRMEDVALDGSVLAFTAGVTLVASLLFGVVPALRGSSTRLADALKDRGLAAEVGAQGRLRSGVVVAQVALSTLLLIGAGLMVRSFIALQRVEPGWEADGVLTLSAPIPFARYPEAQARNDLLEAIRDRLAALPGVEAASAVFPLPLSNVEYNGRWGLEEALTDPSAFQQADYVAVLPGAFEALGTRVLAGRGFEAADQADSAAVVVVDAVLAEKAFPGGSAVGQRILTRATREEPDWVQIVGVVEAQRRSVLSEPGRGTIFFPDRWVGSFSGSWVLRTAGDPVALAGSLRDAVRAVDPSIPVADVRPMGAYVADATAATRFALLLLTAFGILALILASIGLYGVLAYVVGQRRAEIGVRIALGARAGRILRMVLRQGLLLSAVGIVVGLAAAAGLTRLMENLLVGVAPTDLATFAAVSGVFLAVATFACAAPALRAARVDPVVALREEG